MHFNISRRKFLATAGCAGGAALLSRGWLRAAEEVVMDPLVAEILMHCIGVDMHNHIYPAGTEPHPQHGPSGDRPDGGPQGGPGPEPEAPSADAELFIANEVRESGFTAVCASFVLDFAANKKPGDALENYLHWLDAIDAQLEKGHIHRALNLKDLQAAHDRGRPTIVQTVEGAVFIEGKLERVEQVYKRGLRHLQLLHERDDMVSPLGDINTEPKHLGGLTAFGAEVVKECNRLGILVDLAHASDETVLGALKVATQPLIISHTNLDTWTGRNSRMAKMMRPRLISKEQATAVAEAGGIVGVWTHLADSLREFVESIMAMVGAIGIDHVGIGTDTDLLSPRPGHGLNTVYPGLKGGFFRAVIGEMLRQGFKPDQISKIGGGNYCRLFGKVTGRG